MLSKKVEEALNEQILMEGASSNFYLAMAVWAEQNGYSGVSDFYTSTQTKNVFIC